MICKQFETREKESFSRTMFGRLACRVFYSPVNNRGLLKSFPITGEDKLFYPNFPAVILKFNRYCSVNNIAMSANADSTSTAPVIGTHSGQFHCDDALACYMLQLLPEYANAKIMRSRDIALLRKECSIIVDVGGEFDHQRKWYDHHQINFQETFSSLRPEFLDYRIR